MKPNDELLLEQIMDIMYQDDGPSTEDRSLAMGVIVQAVEDIARDKDELSQDALAWIKACERSPGGFGYYAGQLGRKPEAMRDMIMAWVARGCTPLDRENDDR